MKAKTTYTLTLNGEEVAKGKNQVFTSYFNEAPRNDYFVQLGSGTSELPFESINLETHEITAGKKSHFKLQKNVTQTGNTINYSFAGTWSTLSTPFIGSICEVGFGYNNSVSLFNMLSRARFLDNDENPILIEITKEDSLGIKAYMEVIKDINTSTISFEATDSLTITGTLHEVNLDNWFNDYISQPLPSNLNVALLTINNLFVQSDNFNRFTGNRIVIKTGSLTKSSIKEVDNRTDKYSSYFAPSTTYTFTHIGVYEGSANVDENYFVIVALDNPITITEFEEFSLAFNVKLTEQEINA